MSAGEASISRASQAAAIVQKTLSAKAERFTESVIREMTRLAFQYDAVNMAQGNEPSAPPCDAAITSSASMIPAIGASTMGNSVLKRSRSRRSGHMVCSLG